jgi:ubiquinone/menaquinone biosynthesis C-methylase UbiE
MNDNLVIEHYSTGELENKILSDLAAQGYDTEHLLTDQLAAFDEFHIEGRASTVRLVDQMDIHPGLRVLDLGSGLGGPARYLAETYDVTVTGIDLTPELVAVAQSLNRRTGLGGKVEFRLANATKLPFSDASFDRICMNNVGFNIADKQRLLAEARRVLTDDGIFGIFEVLATEMGPVTYPTPWATSEEISFLVTPKAYIELLKNAGLEVTTQTDCSSEGITFFHDMDSQIAAGGPTLALVFGDTAPIKSANMIDNLNRGVIASTELICRPIGPSRS